MRPRCTFVLLNPSSADERRDDPTVRRCLRFARDLGFGSLAVVNLFALRAMDPRTLIDAKDPIGPGNDGAIADAARAADAIVLGWGAWGSVFARRTADVRALLVPVESRLRVFGYTRRGEPRHPLYLRAGAAVRPAR